LKACHNDANNMYEYLLKAQGFREEEVLLLIDDGKHQEPTKRNIQDAFVRMTQYSQPGDVVFVSYSGHGGRIKDTDGK
jgi:metacaspase-1